MKVEYWSREEIEEYCEDPNLLISKVNQMRYQMFRELIKRIGQSLIAIFKR